MADTNNGTVGVRRQYGNTQGQYDNYSWSTLDLFGTPDAPGLYPQMRYKNVQIKKSMDDRRNFLASIQIEFAGKNAKQLNAWWNTFQASNRAKGFRFTLGSFMANQLDQISTYGFSLQEKRWKIDPDMGPCLYVWQIDPVTIFEFNQPNGRDTKPQNIRFWNTKADTQLYLPADQFYLESNPIFPGKRSPSPLTPPNPIFNPGWIPDQRCPCELILVHTPQIYFGILVKQNHYGLRKTTGPFIFKGWLSLASVKSKLEPITSFVG